MILIFNVNNDVGNHDAEDVGDEHEDLNYVDSLDDDDDNYVINDYRNKDIDNDHN